MEYITKEERDRIASLEDAVLQSKIIDAQKDQWPMVDDNGNALSVGDKVRCRGSVPYNSTPAAWVETEIKESEFGALYVDGDIEGIRTVFTMGRQYLIEEFGGLRTQRIFIEKVNAQAVASSPK